MAGRQYDFTAADSLHLRGLGVSDPDSDLQQKLAKDVARLIEEKREMARECFIHRENWNEAVHCAETLIRERESLRTEVESLSFRVWIFGVLFACSVAGQVLGYLGWRW